MNWRNNYIAFSNSIQRLDLELFTVVNMLEKFDMSIRMISLRFYKFTLQFVLIRTIKVFHV